MTNQTRLSFQLYTTNTNKSVNADGLLVFHSDDGGETYEGFVELAYPKLRGTGVHGKRVSPCGDLTILQLVGVDPVDNLNFTLLRNDLESRLSYAGSATTTNGTFSISAVVSEEESLSS